MIGRRLCLVLALIAIGGGPDMGMTAPTAAETAAFNTALDAIAGNTVRTGPSGARDDVASIAILLKIDLPTLPSANGNRRAPGASNGIVEQGNLQIALTQLSIEEGTNNQLRVLRGQNGQNDAIFLREGPVTLRDVLAAATAQGLTGISANGPVIHLSRPLVVWQDAALIVEPGDVLELDAATGAFLLGFGNIDIRNATVQTSVGENDGDPAYRPFLLVSGQGSFYAAESEFAGLGMAGLGAFSGIAVSFCADTPAR
jgi:hypothetical protein